MLLIAAGVNVLADADSLQRSVDAFLPFGLLFGLIGVGFLLFQRYAKRKNPSPESADPPAAAQERRPIAAPAAAKKPSAGARPKPAGPTPSVTPPGSAVDDSQANLHFITPPPTARPEVRNLPPAPGRTRYVVSGTDAETKMRTRWRVEALGPDEARRKGEREGIVVDAVQLDEGNDPA